MVKVIKDDLLTDMKNPSSETLSKIKDYLGNRWRIQIGFYDNFKFIIHKKRNFTWTEDKNLIDADAYVRQLLFAGNFICTSRRYHFKASSLTA